MATLARVCGKTGVSQWRRSGYAVISADFPGAGIGVGATAVSRKFVAVPVFADEADDAVAIHPCWTLVTLFPSDQGLTSAINAGFLSIRTIRGFSIL